VGATCHPSPRVVAEPDSSTSPTAPRSPLQLGPHAKADPLAYLRPPPPPGRASQNPSRPRAPPPEPAGTLERRRRCSPPPLPLRRREAVPELRKEVRSSPVPLVLVPMHRVAEEGSPELRRRTAPPRRDARRPRRDLAVRAALGCFAVARASPWCGPRVQSSTPARSRAAPASPPPSTAARRRTCACLHPQPSDRDLTISAQFDPSQPPPPVLAVGSRSNGSDLADRGQYWSNPTRSSPFCKETPKLLSFTNRSLRSS
jgi:hypothetical protein